MLPALINSWCVFQAPYPSRNAGQVLAEIVRIIKADPLKNVVLDLEGVEYFDSGGNAILMEVEALCAEAQNTFEIRNVPPKIQRAIILPTGQERTSRFRRATTRKGPNLIEQVGDGACPWSTLAGRC